MFPISVDRSRDGKKKAQAGVKVLNSVHHTYNFWQDKCLRFDTSASNLRLRSKCEYVCAMFDTVEDVKGNSKDYGVLTITNLRVMWCKTASKPSNISIGLNTIVQVECKSSKSPILSRPIQACAIVCNFQQCRYQFLFFWQGGESRATRTVSDATSNHASPGQAEVRQEVSHGDAKNAATAGTSDNPIHHKNRKVNTTNKIDGSKHTSSPSPGESDADDKANSFVAGTASTDEAYSSATVRLVNIIELVHMVYQKSRAYRNVMLCASVTQDNQLTLLANEQIISQTMGVNQVSKDEGIMGVLIVTNVRVVWFATLKENTNASLPYMQFTGLYAQKGKFGHTLVVETSTHSSSLVLGFGVNTVERLNLLFDEVRNMWKAWSAKPILGMPPKEVLMGLILAKSERQASEPEAETCAGSSTEVTKVPTILDCARGASDKAVLRRVGGDNVVSCPTDSGVQLTDGLPMYDYTVGLAVQKLPDGVTLMDLWSVPLP